MVWSLLELDILEWKMKWALGSITTDKASGSTGIPAVLFQILKDDAVGSLSNPYLLRRAMENNSN